MSIRDLIAALRGGTPKTCDWCGEPTPEEDLIPVSGGEWCCLKCLNIPPEPDALQPRG
jgi:formylmethanofuran dehydrogenase subunit E